MVTASCRIGYDFSTPDGPLTMKLAETPSRSAGLIISVFGVASSPMASLLARKTRRLGGAPSVRGRAGSVKERRAGSGSASAAQPGRAADRRLRVLVVRDQRHLPLIHARQVLALRVCVALG